MYAVLVSSMAMEDSKYVESHVTAMDLQALSGAGLLLSFPEYYYLFSAHFHSKYYPLLLQWTE